MTTDDSNMSNETANAGLSSAEFASESLSFVKHLAAQMAIDIDAPTLQRLSDRIRQGVSREQIIASLRSMKGLPQPVDRGAAALEFARSGRAGEALIVENITSFAPQDDKAFLLYAYAQVLGRHPDDVELARLTHHLEGRTLSRLDVLKRLNSTSMEEGRALTWDSALVSLSGDSSVDGITTRGLVEGSGYRTLSRDAAETLTLCRFDDGKWELAPSMVARIDEIRSDSWIVSDGFVLTGPKSHLSAGEWLLELDIVQPEWASVVVDVVANLAADRLFHLTAHGSLRGSFVFEKLNTHAFLEVRLLIRDARPAQWISIQSVRLRKMDR